MWSHDCPVNGPTETEAGEPCPWCDVEAVGEDEVIGGAYHRKHVVAMVEVR